MKCRHCGAQLSETAKFCGVCGSKVERETVKQDGNSKIRGENYNSEKENEKNKKNTGGKKGILSVILLLCVIVAGTGFFYYKNKGGVTLESTIDDTNIVMPEWDFNTPSSVTAWEEASNVYAEQVSGEIRAVVGSELRPGNIWENIELPRLKANPNVTKVTTIDPKTGVEKIIFER